MSVHTTTPAATLHNIATRLRLASVRATSEAGSGHPTSCCSAAEIVATIFFGEMRFDPGDPRHPGSDRFVLSKGHAAPLLYAAWSEAGLIDADELLRLRKLESDLEGHPTPRLGFVDVATGSLGQGLAAAVGIALHHQRLATGARTYVLLGDGETAEGSVWEAAQMARHYALDGLCGVVDVNALGQSGPTQFAHRLDLIAKAWQACGWHTLIVDGHDVSALQAAFAEARTTRGRPTMILARTLKGKGISFVEGRDGWHGKPIPRGEQLEQALRELEAQRIEGADETVPIPAPRRVVPPSAPDGPDGLPDPPYAIGDQVATREAYGEALVALGRHDPRVVALDGDVKNSTFSETFERAFPDRFYQAFIAEQAMIGAAMGLASQGSVPFPSSFACFLTRAYDFIRMAGISNLNVKLAGSHAGVSIGEDGPSQMALEDLAMMRAVPNCTVLYPCDATSTARLIAACAYRAGPAYVRTTRPKTPVLYGPQESFAIGGSKVLRSSPEDAATIVAAGVTVFEALRAHDTLLAEGVVVRVIDAYSVQPIDADTLLAAGRETRALITVEDHYSRGGLGDAVCEAVSPAGVAVHRLAVREIPRSGTPAELLEKYGISAARIVETVRALLDRS